VFEYMVINIDGKTSDELETTLNFYAKDGWYVICDSLCGIVMERPSESSISEGKNVTYSFHLTPVTQSSEEE